MSDDQIWSLCMALGAAALIIGLSIILALGQISRAISSPKIVRHYHHNQPDAKVNPPEHQ